MPKCLKVLMLLLSGAMLCLPGTAAADSTARVSEGGGTYGGMSRDGSRVFFTTGANLLETDGAVDLYERSGGALTLLSPDASDAVVYKGASRDGSRVFFERASGVYERAGGATTQLSPAGATYAGASRDGTRVFFHTTAALADGDTDSASDVYERHAGVTTLISTGTENRAANFSGASADGTHVVFSTDESLDPADSDYWAGGGYSGADLYERHAGVTTLASRGANSPGQSAFFNAISEDGAKVFFSALDIDPDGYMDVYERSGGETKLVSVPPGGHGANSATFSRISPDGSRVFFVSDENMVPEDTDGLNDVYERTGGVTTLISTGTLSGSADASSFSGASEDGSRVFFRTTERLADGDTDTVLDIYERSGGATTLVSAGETGGNANLSAVFHAAAADGSRVAFSTIESLVATDTDSVRDVYERVDGTTKLVSTGPLDQHEATTSTFTGISADGARVAFTSASVLSSGDTDTASDVFLRTVDGVNHPPAVAGGGTLEYTENQAATPISAGLTVSDANGDALSGASAQITTNAASGDVLSWSDNNPDDAIGKDTAASTEHHLVLTGAGSMAEYQAALRAISFASTSDAPSSQNRTVTFFATDAGSASGSGTATITVAVTDDAPGPVDDSETVEEDSGASTFDVLSDDTDVDGGDKTITDASDPANGTVAITNAGADLTYAPDANYCNSQDGGADDTFTYTVNGGPTATVSVEVTCVGSAPHPTAKPRIRASSWAVGSTVTSDHGRFSGSPEPEVTEVRWVRCTGTALATCTFIAGDDAGDDTYVLAEADRGTRLRSVVTAVSSEGSARGASIGVLIGLPRLVSQPTISGSKQTGKTLTADPGEWTENPSPDGHAFQWLRCADTTVGSCDEISGETSSTYVLTDADDAKRIRVRTTASNAAGTSTASTSKATGKIDIPVVELRPAFTGSTTTGSTLTTDHARWTGGPAEPTYAVQWMRCTGVAFDTCTAIDNATQDTYTLAPEDEGLRIRSRVRATNPSGTSAPAYSSGIVARPGA